MILNILQERKKVAGYLCMHMFIILLGEVTIQSALILIPYDEPSDIKPQDISYLERPPNCSKQMEKEMKYFSVVIFVSG